MTGVIVVGGSIGGVRTAQQLRRAGYAGTIALVERERHLPYDKPPLSKAVLDGDQEGPPTLMSPDGAAELGIELQLGTGAAALDLGQRTLHLADGSTMEYDDALVVATGARARRSPWSGWDRVHELRSWDDAEALRDALLVARSLVVIGAGFIGAEVASAARKRGLQVDIVDVAPVPMARHFGEAVGSLFVDLHQTNGVVPHFGTGVAELTTTGDGVTVRLDDGTSLSADLAVVGLGTELNTEWLAGSGIAVDDGVICDHACRADVAASVFAVGDVARWWHPQQELLVRSEHWTNAVEQAAVVAHNITHDGDPRSHSPVGYVWSNQYDWKIQIAGNPAAGVHHELVTDGADRLVSLWADADGALCGVLTVNWQQLSVRGRQALMAGHDLADARARMFPEDTQRPEPARSRGAAQ
jgi:NADPH-dependent 2,4-dienoyl-CoA reductase/sulfur reductase-like enzyme